MAEERLDVVGIGNAIVDVLSHAEDEFLAREGLAKGGILKTLFEDRRELGDFLPDPADCSGLGPLREPRCVGCDIVEISPPLDVNNMTGRLNLYQG